MKFTVLTLFPEVLDAYFASSIMARAVERGIVGYQPVNIRDFALDKHRSCDDAPYGGGPGMLMLCEPAGRAFEFAGVPKRPVVNGSVLLGNTGDDTGPAKPRQSPDRLAVYLSPSGELLNQHIAAELAREKELVLLCGRYEGVDQRILDLYVDREISIGDYVLSSGEIAALVLIDAVYRLLDGVISGDSLIEESFQDGLLEYPQWTRPLEYANLSVPDILLSGHHERIRQWRQARRLEKTAYVRPDIIQRLGGHRGEDEGARKGTGAMHERVDGAYGDGHKNGAPT